MDDETLNFLSLFFQQELEQGRHQEKQRMAETNILVGICVGVIALVLKNELTLTSIPLSIILAFLGLYGFVVSMKYKERISFHFTRAARTRDKIDNLLKTDIIELNEHVIQLQKARFKFVFKVRLYWLWNTFFTIIFSVGIILTIIAYNN